MLVIYFGDAVRFMIQCRRDVGCKNMGLMLATFPLYYAGQSVDLEASDKWKA